MCVLGIFIFYFYFTLSSFLMRNDLYLIEKVGTLNNAFTYYFVSMFYSPPNKPILAQ